MRIYVGVVSRGTTPDHLRAARITAAARRSLAFDTDGRPHAEWSSGAISLAAWHNEPEQADRPLLSASPAGVEGVSGYRFGDGPDPAGVWARFTAHDRALSATTCASGAEVVFVAETPEFLVLGNQALLVHLVAHPDGPHPDPVGLAGVLNAGFCVTDRTSFLGVRALGVDQVATATTGGLRVTAADTAQGASTAEDVAHALVESVAPLADREDAVRLGLTGGRDSRLLVALLCRSGVPVRTQTFGNPDDPDVDVARQVAAALDVPHRVGRPMGLGKQDDAVSVDVRGRLHEAVVLANGMLGGYDRVGRINAEYNASTVPFSGAGGEILRGYYAGAVADMDHAEVVQRYLRGRVAQSRNRMTSRMRTAYDQDLTGWRDQVRRDGAAALEDYYVRQRTARWTGMARHSASIGSLAWRPYLDHRVVRAVRRVPLQVRTSERLVADLLATLAPELAEVPFAGQRWKFEKHPPKDPAARAAWEARAPVVGRHGDQTSFNWRLDLPEVRAELASVVREAPDSFWQIADRSRVEDFLARAEPSRPNTMRLWNWATVATALASDFAAGENRLDTRERIIVTTHAPTAGTGPSRRERNRAHVVRLAKRVLLVTRRLTRRA